MEANQDMPLLMEHPDIPSTSILKRRIKGSNTPTKSVNFFQCPETKCQVDLRRTQSNEGKDIVRHKYNTPEDNYDYIFKYDEPIGTPERQKIICLRRNRSQSLPSKKILLNSGVFVEGTRWFVLRNRSNAKDTNVKLPTYELR